MEDRRGGILSGSMVRASQVDISRFGYKFFEDDKFISDVKDLK